MLNFVNRLRSIFGIETDEEYEKRIDEDQYLQRVCEWYGCDEEEGRKTIKEMEGQ